MCPFPVFTLISFINIWASRSWLFNSQLKAGIGGQGGKRLAGTKVQEKRVLAIQRKVNLVFVKVKNRVVHNKKDPEED